MNIDKLAEHAGAADTTKIAAIGSPRLAPVAESDKPVSSDQIDMSMIGKLMARSLRALADNEEIRPEVLNLHQQLPRQTARFDDSTIDHIFRRM